MIPQHSTAAEGTDNAATTSSGKSGIFGTHEPADKKCAPTSRNSGAGRRARMVAAPGRATIAISTNPDCPHTAPGQLFEYGQTILVDLFKLSLVVDHVSGFIVAWEVDRLGNETTSADVKRLVELSFRSRVDALGGDKQLGGGPCAELLLGSGLPIESIKHDDRFVTSVDETGDGCTPGTLIGILDQISLETKIVMTEPASLALGAVAELRAVPVRLAPQIRFFALAVAHGVWRSNYRPTPGRSTSAFERLIGEQE